MNRPIMDSAGFGPAAGVEYQGRPVVTFKMVDEIHDRPPGAARKAFHNHKGKMVEGEDFLRAPYSDWAELLPAAGPKRGGFRGTITFLTPSGYRMLLKSFRDEIAWEKQRQWGGGHSGESF